MKALITFPAHKKIAPLVWKGTLWAEDLELKSQDEVEEMLTNAGIDEETVSKVLSDGIEALKHSRNIPTFKPDYQNENGEGYAFLDLKKQGDMVVVEAGDGYYEIALVPLVKKYTPPSQ